MAPPGVTTFPALGTTATVIASDVGRLVEAVTVVRDEIDQIDRACSRFRTDSDLARLHGSPDRWTTVSPALFEAVEVAVGAARATDGVVDPTVGDAVRRMGYDRDFARIAPTGPQISSRPARDGLLGLAATAALAIALCGRKPDLADYIQPTVRDLADLLLRLDERIPRPGPRIAELLGVRPVCVRDLKLVPVAVRDARAVR
jgi:hypothetical protein